MAKTYKAPSGLGSAVRGRSMVQRDYTSGVKFKAQEREADRALTQATLGIVQQVAGGVQAASSALGDNLESHKDLETGARRVFESSGQEGTFEDSGFQGQQGFFKKLFTQAGEGSKTQMIGGAEFSTSELTNIGKADSVMAERMGTAIKNESGDITGYQSLFDSFKSQKPLAMSSKPKTGTDIIKDTKQENQRKNVVSTGKKAVIEVGPIKTMEALNTDQAQVAQSSGAKTVQELATEESDGAFGGYTSDNKTGMPTASKVNLPKSRSDMTMWEKHLDNMGGKSKYFENEKEFLSHRESLIEKLKKHNP